MEYPGGVFYLCYDCVLCLLIRDRRTASLGRMGSGLLVSDFISNVINLYLSSGVRGLETEARALLPPDRTGGGPILHCGHDPVGEPVLPPPAAAAGARAALPAPVPDDGGAEKRAVLFKKNSDDIEQVMTNAYRLYERLGRRKGRAVS